MPHTDNKRLSGKEGNHDDAVLASLRAQPVAHGYLPMHIGHLEYASVCVLRPPPVVICKRCNATGLLDGTLARVGKVGKMAKSVRMLTTKLPALLACGCCWAAGLLGCRAAGLRK